MRYQNAQLRKDCEMEREKSKRMEERLDELTKQNENTELIARVQEKNDVQIEFRSKFFQNRTFFC